MTAKVQDGNGEQEAAVLDNLKQTYEAQGFAFTTHPPAEMVPGFLDSYRPDALAQKPGQNVVIEIKNPRTSGAERSIAAIRQKFVNQSGWRLEVVYSIRDSFQSTSIPATAPVTVRDRLQEVKMLNDEGHRRAAFLLAWSLLEAALQSLGGEAANRPRAAGAVVQSLAMNGHISPPIESRLWASVDLRNRMVHGDLSVEPSSDDVELMLTAIHEALAPEPA